MAQFAEGVGDKLHRTFFGIGRSDKEGIDSEATLQLFKKLSKDSEIQDQLGEEIKEKSKKLEGSGSDVSFLTKEDFPKTILIAMETSARLMRSDLLTTIIQKGDTFLTPLKHLKAEVTEEISQQEHMERQV